MTKPQDDTKDGESEDSSGRLGAFIKTQRKLANLSQRELAKLTNLSDPYVSQIERGLHEPSIRVVRAMSKALNIQVETMLSYAGLIGDTVTGGSQASNTESAIRCDDALDEDQKRALLGVYRSFLTANAASNKRSKGTKTKGTKTEKPAESDKPVKSGKAARSAKSGKSDDSAKDGA